MCHLLLAAQVVFQTEFFVEMFCFYDCACNQRSSKLAL